MKLIDAIVKKPQPTSEDCVISEVSHNLPKKPAGAINHHSGIIHLMGIEPNSTEYEEMSTDLDRLAVSNPSLYHKIVNQD